MMTTREEIIEKAADYGVQARDLCAPNEWRSICENMADDGIKIAPDLMGPIMFRVAEKWRAYQQAAGVKPRYWVA